MTKTFDNIEQTIIPRVQNYFIDALATLAFMVEIPEGVWTWRLGIEQSYKLVHKERTKSLVLAIDNKESLGILTS